jgi:hypothetical protein
VLELLPVRFFHHGREFVTASLKLQRVSEFRTELYRIPTLSQPTYRTSSSCGMSKWCSVTNGCIPDRYMKKNGINQEPLSLLWCSLLEIWSTELRQV